MVLAEGMRRTSGPATRDASSDRRGREASGCSSAPYVGRRHRVPMEQEGQHRDSCCCLKPPQRAQKNRRQGDNAFCFGRKMFSRDLLAGTQLHTSIELSASGGPVGRQHRQTIEPAGVEPLAGSATSVLSTAAALLKDVRAPGSYAGLLDWRWRQQAEVEPILSQPYENPFKGVGRNDPCPCGSGKKFKRCCLN